jgi:hypothetical protein
LDSEDHAYALVRRDKLLGHVFLTFCSHRRRGRAGSEADRNVFSAAVHDRVMSHPRISDVR